MDLLDRRTATLQSASGSAHTGADLARIDAPAELEHVQHDGLLPLVLRDSLHPAGAA